MDGEVNLKIPNGAAYYSIDENVKIIPRVEEDKVTFILRFDRTGKKGKVTMDKEEFFSYFERYIEE